MAKMCRDNKKGKLSKELCPVDITFLFHTWTHL